jgi:hypothetical protein
MQDDADADECFRMMETLYASCCSDQSDCNWNTHHQLLYSSDERLWSPVSVIIRLETAGASGRLINNSRSAVSRRRLFDSPAPQDSTKLQDDNGNTHVRDEDISHTHITNWPNKLKPYYYSGSGSTEQLWYNIYCFFIHFTVAIPTNHLHISTYLLALSVLLC